MPAGDYDEDNFFDGQFADASDNSFEDFEEEEDDTIDHPSCPETVKMFNAKFREVIMSSIFLMLFVAFCLIFSFFQSIKLKKIFISFKKKKQFIFNFSQAEK